MKVLKLENRMVQFTGHFDGKTLIPDGEVEIPAGRLRITLEPVDSASIGGDEYWAQVMQIVREAEALNPDLPADFAAQHDHYLHGAPKR